MREARCGICKGLGHMSDMCSNNQGQNSYIGFSESESDEEEDKNMTGFVVFPAIIGDSDSDSDEEIPRSVITTSNCCNMSAEELYESWIKLGEEKIELYKRKLQQEERIAALEKMVKEKKEENDKKDEAKKRKVELDLTIQNSKLSEAIKEEQQKSINLQAELSETYKKVRMLNNGTTKLDKILSEGRMSKSYYGIGYNGEENTAKTIFVPSSTSHADEMKTKIEQKDGESRGMMIQQNSMKRSYNQKRSHKDCYHCGKYGHIRRKCKVFKRWVQTLVQQGHGYQNKGRKNQVWISKVKLYKKTEPNRTKSSRLGAADQTKTTQGGFQGEFVAGSKSHEAELEPEKLQKGVMIRETMNQQDKMWAYESDHVVLKRSQKVCYHCGKFGHIRRNCYHFKRRVQALIHQGFGFQNKSRRNQVWIPKAKLYNKTEIPKPAKESNHIAFMAGKNISKKRWYFDSGASQHMTGNLDLLDEYVEIEESKVTFGGGVSGMIKGKGRLSSPDLKNVFYVQGLKVNLISVSQLSDEGYTVSFNGKNCRVRDNNDKTVMTGIRADKNCYVWEPMDVCFKAEKNEMIFDCICTSKQKEI